MHVNQNEIMTAPPRVNLEFAAFTDSLGSKSELAARREHLRRS